MVIYNIYFIHIFFWLLFQSGAIATLLHGYLVLKIKIYGEKYLQNSLTLGHNV